MMMTSQSVFEELQCDTERRDLISENATTMETMDDAERRATQVFELLLTVLSCPPGPCRTNPAK